MSPNIVDFPTPRVTNMRPFFNSLENSIYDELCGCITKGTPQDYVQAAMLIGKLHFSNPDNIKDPLLRCYAEPGGSSQLAFVPRRLRTEAEQQRDASSGPIAEVFCSGISRDVPVLGANFGVDITGSRACIGREQTVTITTRFVMKNYADMLRVIEEHDSLMVTLGALLLHQAGVGRLRLGGVAEPTLKEQPPDEYFRLDSQLVLTYTTAAVRVHESHRIAGFFLQTNSQP